MYIFLCIFSVVYSFQKPYKLVRYKYNEYTNLMQPFVQYTHFKIIENNAYSYLKKNWKKHNLNIHKGIQYAKRKQDKSIYFGLSYTNDNKLSNIETHVCDCKDLSDIFFTLEISSHQTVKLTNIITNPSRKVNFEILKFALRDMKQSGIYIDLSYIRDYDNKRLYLELLIND